MRRLTLVVLAGLACAPAAATAATGGLSYRLSHLPREAMFGDPVVQEVEVVVDRAEIAPGSVRVHVDTRPYRIVARSRSVSRGGALTRIRFDYRLECLSRRCLPGGEERVVRFAPVRITYPAGTQIAYWPDLRVASRIDPRAVSRPALRSELTRQPHVTYRIAPGALVALLVAGAALLLAFPALLLLAAARRGLRALRTSRLERLSPLERALLLLRASTERERGTRRRALERLARELRGHELATEARRLAWSRPAPEPDDVQGLRGTVEAELERHR